MNETPALALQSEFPDIVRGVARQSGVREQWRVDVSKDGVLPVLTYAKTRLGYCYLADITAVDYLSMPNPPEHRFAVVYVLRSREVAEPLVIRALVPENDAVVESVTPLWDAADWLEREVFDLFGITFHHHPNLIRILMPENFDAHPLRKDFPTEGVGYRDDFPIVTR